MTDRPTPSRPADSLATSLSLMARLEQRPDDPSAWADLVRRYGPCILDWCRRSGLQEADAEDVAQTVLARLAGRMATFRYDPAESFRAYLKTLTRYAWCDLIAARTRRPAVVRTDVADGDPLAAVAAHDDLAARLEREYDLDLYRAAVETVRGRVAPATWQAFQRVELDGLSARQVAAELGTTVVNVYKARSNVRRMLRQVIAAAEGGG
jgi:RNA polymerase sigma-70 factor (ECF subfamily)